MGTALVTGATAGIGAAFARRLAREGYDLVLVARDGGRLQALAVELRADAGVNVEVLPADLTDPVALRRVEERLAHADCPVEVLVNSAGMGARHGFVPGGVDDEEQLLRLNVLAVLRLSKAAVGGMVERQRGAIVNLSSVAGFLPYGTYSASKAWVTSFSEALAVELASTGVRVVALCPGLVRTEFHERAGMDVSNLPSWAWLGADDVADVGWRAVAAGQVVVIPSRRYRALVELLRHLPLAVAVPTARLVRAGRRLP